jgi:hypothetical protein
VFFPRWRFFVRILLCDELEDEARGLFADVAAALIDAGERDAEFAIVVEVAAADHGKVFGNAHALLDGLKDDADGDDIIEAEDAVGRVRKLAEVTESGGSVGLAIHVGAAGLDEIFGWERDFVLVEGVEEAFEAAATGAVFASANVGDALALHGDEVLGGELAGGVIVGPDEVAGEGIEVAVEEDKRDIAKACSGDEGWVHLAGGDDEGVETVGKHLLDLLHLEDGVFFRRRDDEEVPLLAKGAGETFGDLGEERMQQVGDDETDELGTACDERTGGEVGAVAQLLDTRFDAFAGLEADVGVVAQRFGDGDKRNAQVPRDVLHLDGHMRTIHSPADSFWEGNGSAWAPMAEDRNRAMGDARIGERA